MAKAKNPYIINAPIGEEDFFVGRGDIFTWIYDNLAAGQRILVLYGRPKIGKTSLLNQLPLHLFARYVPVTATVEPNEQKRFGDLLWHVVSDIREGLLKRQKVVLPQITPKQMEGEVDYVRDFFLPVARHALGDHCLVICLDGLSAEDLAHEPVARLLDYLHDLVSSEENVRLILTIRGQRGADEAIPWLQEVPTKELGYLSESEAEELLIHPALHLLAYDYEAVRHIYGLTSGHPYFTQLFGYVLYERRATAGWVGSPDVTAATEEVLALGDEEFEQLWKLCSPSARVILAMLGHMRGRQGIVSLEDVSNALRWEGFQVPLKEIANALEELVALGILRRLGTSTYRFDLELLRLWIQKTKSLAEVLHADKRLRRIMPTQAQSRRKEINWIAVMFWALAFVLVGLIGFAWQSRDHLARRDTPTPGTSTATTALVISPQPISSPTPVPTLVTSYIAYMSKEHPADTWEIWLMRSDGSDPQQLTRNDANDITPCWSPDGKRIAFVSDRDGNREIYVMNADGNEQINLTMHPAEDASPCWSPDGSRIAFASFRDGNWEIYVMQSDGSDPIRLTDNEAADYSPCWSPDGSRIAFASKRDGNWEIYVMQSDGSNPTRLTNEEATDFAPSWSPDGSLIAFETYRDGNMEIYVMSPDGYDQTNVTNDLATDDHGPSWAPWSGNITYYSNRDGGWDIFAMRADGTEKVNLTLSQATEQAPAWKP